MKNLIEKAQMEAKEKIETVVSRDLGEWLKKNSKLIVRVGKYGLSVEHPSSPGEINIDAV